MSSTLLSQIRNARKSANSRFPKQVGGFQPQSNLMHVLPPSLVKVWVFV
jgi:hypothetical protein